MAVCSPYATRQPPIDLNPIRAGIASTPEDSEFTSIHARIRQHSDATSGTPKPTVDSALAVRVPLLAFNDGAGASVACIPFSLGDYLGLVGFTGRSRRDKRGAIVEHLPAVAQRLNIDPEAWLRAMQPSGNTFGRALGQLDHLRLHAKTLGQSWVRGLQRAQLMYRAS